MVIRLRHFTSVSSREHCNINSSAFIIYRGYGHHWINVTSDSVYYIVPYLLLTTSVILAMTSSFFSYVVNLYSVPGIQPDSYPARAGKQLEYDYIQIMGIPYENILYDGRFRGD
jgi:hypothetical protein